MRDDQYQFLTIRHLPARLTAEQAAWMLNCQTHDLPALMKAKLLKPLGNPPANGGKFFATADLLELTNDRNWLVRITTTIYQHWHKRNGGSKGGMTHGEPGGSIPIPFRCRKGRESAQASASG